MSTEQHEALKAADWIEELLPDIGGKEAAEKIRTQHALIVQMAEALQKLACLGNGDQPGNSTGNVIAQQALAPATQYLKGPKP